MFDIDPRGALGSLLTNKLLKVPYYQRAYSWKESHAQELFDDLRRAIESGDRDYFLGSIIACLIAPGQLEIVDGQQRLATTAILFAAMRDYAIEIENQRAADLIANKFLYRSRSITNGDDDYNLTLGETDDAYFRKRILSPPSSREESSSEKANLRDSTKNLSAVYRIARKHVNAITAGKDKNDAASTLQKWMDFIEFRARVIVITVEDHEEAQMIFETMNDRGLDLSIADLTKNHLFLQSGDKIEEAKSRWFRMVGALEAVSNKDITKYYIHHLYASQYGIEKSRDVFGAIRSITRTRGNALEFLKHLGDNAIIYAALRNSDHEFWGRFGSDARHHIRVISSSLRVTQINILLLAIIGKFSEEQVKKFMPKAVCWSVRFLIAGGPTGNLETFYSQMAMRITKGEITTTDELAMAARGFLPTDEEFRASFESATVNTNYLARYYLQCLEKVATAQAKPHLGEDNEQLGSLEHILPQNPLSVDWPNITPEDVASHAKRIGNLALLNPNSNSQRGNSNFDESRIVYENCDMFVLTKQVAEYAEWGPMEIDDRQRILAGYAIDAWPI